jgi:serine/threonine-protein kinase
MAPEQEKDDPRPQSDVYALGLCFYEMLTGVRARPAQGWTPLTQLLPGCPPALDGVLAYTFDPDPAKRYPTAGQLAAAAAQVCGSSPA